MSRIPQAPSTKRTVTKSSKLVPASSATKIATVRPTGQTAGPSLLQKKVFKEALSKSALDPKTKVVATGAQRRSIPTPSTMTKRGAEKVLQKITVEKTIQRTPKAEYIAKTIRGVDASSRGRAQQLEVTSHQINPAYGTESAGVNLTLSSKSSVTVTSRGKQIKKTLSKKVLKDKSTASKPNLNPTHVNRLVKEEAEDVENTLRMIPPDLISASLEKFPLKRKLQSLRMNSESIAILEQSVIHPQPTADEFDSEATPEVMASVIHAVEKGASPDCAPNQIFNTLFPEVQTDNRIRVSSVAPGPLLDMVVPTGAPQKFTGELLNEEMEKSLVEVQTTQRLPSADFCADNNIAPPARADQGEKKVPTILESEIPPWENSNIDKLYTLVGGEAIDLLEATDPSILETSMEEELSKGIDYFLEADTNPFETKVQLRGSRLPSWFPGYMAAFPHYPEVVRVSKSPSAVLLTAWKAVQPKVFPDESLLIA